MTNSETTTTTADNNSEADNNNNAESTKKKEELLKSLAQHYLTGKKAPGGEQGGGLSCCPTSEQKQNRDGSMDSCSCGPDEMNKNIADQKKKHIPEFNLLLLGDSGVGKTAYLKLHLTGTFDENERDPTTEIMVGSMLFMTNRGVLKFNVWDSCGKAQFGGLKERHEEVHCAAIVFDVTNRATYKNATKKWVRDLNGIKRSIPVVLVGNKCDAANRRIKPDEIVFHRKNNRQYYDVSVKDIINIEMPFLWLAQKLTGIPDLCFVRPTEND